MGSSLLLWSAVPLWLLPSLRLRLTLIPPSSMELTDMVVLATAMELMDMVVSAMLPPMPMVPTTERGPLMPSPRLMPMPTTMELMVLATAMELTDMLVLAMLDTLPPMPTMARGLLMPSPRLRLMPTTMELTVLAMLDSMVDTPMVPTPMPMVLMPTASKMSSQTQIIIAHQVQTEAQKQTKSRSNLTFSAINSFVI